MNGDLRPMGVGEILDAAIKVFVRHWRTLVLSVVGLILPVQVLSALVTASIAPEQFDWTTTESGVEEGEEAAFWIGQAIVAALSVVTLLLATAVCFKAIADAYVGVEPDWRRSLRFAVRRLGGLVGVSVVGGIVVLLGFLALIVPGVWLAVSFSVAVPALLLERIGAIAALRRSFALVRGRWWPAAGALVVGYILVGIVGALVQGVVTIFPSALADGDTVAAAFGAVVGGTLGSALTTPYSAAVVTLLYFDLRVRKEGLDLRLIAEGADVERDPGAPLPPPVVAGECTPEGRAGFSDWRPPSPDAPAQPSGWLPPRAADAGERSGSPPDGGA